MTAVLAPSPTRSANAQLARLFAFAAAALPVGAFITTLAVYLPHYYASQLGLPLAAVGATFALVRLIDIGFDPLLGIAMDHSRTGIGKYRPWLIASAPVLVVASVALYLPSTGVGRNYLLLWLLVLYAGYSILVLSHLAWGAVLVEEYHARSRIYAWLQVMGVLGSIAVLTLPLAAGWLWPDAPVKGVPLMGWFLVLAVPLTAAITASFAHEPVRAERKTERLGWRDYRDLIARPSMARILAADLLCTLGPAITAPLYLFFFEQARGYTPAQANWLLIVYVVAGLVGPAFWARIAVRLGKHSTVWIATVAYAVAQSGLLMLPKAHPAEMSFAMFTVGFVASAFPFLIRAMIADVSDEVLLDTGRDRTALLYSLTTSTAKVGSTLSVGIAYTILPMFGFNPAAGAVNTPDAIWGLEACYLVPPVLFVLLGGLAMWGYRLDAARHAEIRAALGARAQAAIPEVVAVGNRQSAVGEPVERAS